MDAVQDNQAKNRFELHTAGITAFITYIKEGKVYSLVHEEVPEEASGKGIGSALAKGALDLLRSRGEKVIPRCPFIAAYMLRHKETQDLLADPAYFD
ncbi:MAG TPA: GNAT family N-acetyltransferase [Gammaproteobacteria bacterium]|jgi:predicted GNAT family acetyltransferase|nr:GNAT family N-acetyltransferase [Gammaproteobacteria bacterium]